MSICIVADCTASPRALQMCRPHYRRNAIYGDPLGAARVRPLDERFWENVTKSEGCWEWTGTKSELGYGRIFASGRRISKGVHRVSYELNVGPIGKGMEIDHKCHNPSCVKPAHLRQATRKQNRENLSGAQKNSKTGVRGVSLDPKRGSYIAVVGHNKKIHYAGRHRTIAAAEAAVIAKRLELFTHNELDRSA